MGDRSRSPRKVASGSGRLAGRVAVVTGGASGIGASVCERLIDNGARVVIADIDEMKGKALAAKLGVDIAVFQKTDVASESSIEACMSVACARFGRLDILVNNAVFFCFGHLGGAGNGSGTFTDRNISDSDWEKTFNVNVVGYAKCIKHAVKHMRENDLPERLFVNDQGHGVSSINAGSRGAIVNIASVSSYIAQPEFIPYNCSKGAILQLTRCSAMDLAVYKIRVNAVCPGTVETPGSYNHMLQLGLSVDEGRKMFSEGNLLKRQAAPQEIADGVVFLASDDASFMTGAHIVMDGGQTI